MTYSVVEYRGKLYLMVKLPQGWRLVRSVDRMVQQAQQAPREALQQEEAERLFQ